MKKARTRVPSLALLVFLALSSGCFKHSQDLRSPEEVVRTFINLSASAKDSADKEKLKELCGGKLQNAFERMTDEAFRILYLGNNLKIVDLKVLDSSLETESAKVHYQVTVENSQGTDPTREQNEREVTLIKSGTGWVIDTIQMKGSDQIAFTRGMIF